MSDGLAITSSAVRAFDPPTETQRPPATEIQDTAINDLAEVFFISPVAELDVDTSLVLFQFRDSSTGEVTRQFPSEQTLAQRDAGIGLSPQEIVNFAAESAAAAAASPAQEQNAEAIAELQAGNEPPPAVEAPDGPAAAPETATAVAEPANDPVDPPPAPETIQVVSGGPSNGVSDVTNGGTDASPVGEGEIRTLVAEN